MDFTFTIVAVGAGLLGAVAGSVGTFAVLRRQSLLGDSISHAALPGIVLAFILGAGRNPLWLLIGAAAAGWIGTIFIMGIIRRTRIDTSGAQGVVLSVFFGLGLLLLTYVQKWPDASQSGLDKYLFGQAAALLPQDLIIMACGGTLTLVLLMIFWKEIKLLTFDRSFGESLGFPAKKIDLLITALIVLSIVIGLQTVGVILMSSLLVAPAAAARQWTEKLGIMVFLSGVFGAAAGIAGSIVSSSIPNIPTGPAIVMVMTIMVAFSLLFAPSRGLLIQLLRTHQNRFHYSLQSILLDLYQLQQTHGEELHFHDLNTLQLMRSRKSSVLSGLQILSTRGLVETGGGGQWKLTPKGIQEATKFGETYEL